MRYLGTLALGLLFGGVLCGAQTAGARHTHNAALQKQSLRSADLERQVEMIFLQCIRVLAGEKDDRKERIEQLATKEEVTDILRKMVARHRYAREESLGLIYLMGATSMLGELGDKEAERGLAVMIFDRRVHEDVRAMAVRSLGNIDPESNKELLLKALRSKKSDYFDIRVGAAEGLAKVRDPRVRTALEHAARHESDLYVRGKFQEAAQQASSIQ